MWYHTIDQFCTGSKIFAPPIRTSGAYIMVISAHQLIMQEFTLAIFCQLASVKRNPCVLVVKVLAVNIIIAVVNKY